jgi:cytochrome c oxidase subunit 2
MISHYLPAASSYAADLDNLVTLIFVLVGFWFVVCQIVFFWLIIRFRKRDGQRSQYVTGEEKHLKRWITIPHMLVLVCDVFIIIGAVRVWYEIEQSLPPAQETVRVIGQQWAWTFVHPGPDGQLGTSDDITKVNELHVELGKLYHFNLEATDVLHSFSVPAFRLKHDAIPGRVVIGWFKPIMAGQFDIQCAEICGIGHGLMGARIFVETPAQHAAWVSQNSPIAIAAAPAARAEE